MREQLAMYVPGAIVGDELPDAQPIKEPDMAQAENIFDRERRENPQAVIDRLIMQTRRQGGEIHKLNQKVDGLERQLTGARRRTNRARR